MNVHIRMCRSLLLNSGVPPPPSLPPFSFVRFLFVFLGLDGDSDQSAARIDQLNDGVEDLRNAYVKLIYKEYVSMIYLTIVYDPVPKVPSQKWKNF